MKTALITLFALASASASASAFAAEDLSLPGERWLAKPNGFICGADAETQAEKPASLEAMAVAFESVTTDYSLDNVLLKASYVEDGVSCRYSALIFADNAARTLKLVESRAYAADDAATCDEGKALLDGYLEATEYLYWGRPKHVTIMVEDASAAAICGKDATSFGIDFVVAGRI
jgi:hypothetical protein